MTARLGSDNVGDCPVPTGGFLGAISAAQHDTWCDCVYGADAELLRRCKLKAAADPDTWKYIPLPWTEAGKGARELPGTGILGQLYVTAVDQAEAAAKEAIAQAQAAAAAGKGAVVVAVPVESTTPAGSGGPTGLATGPTVKATRDQMLTATVNTGWSVQSVGQAIPEQLGAGLKTISSTGSSVANALSSIPTWMWLGGAALAAYLFLKPKRSFSGFGGYSKRRRRVRYR